MSQRRRAATFDTSRSCINAMARAAIAEAIELGVPAYNAGNVALCTEVYQATARRLLQDHARELAPGVRAQLEEALQQSGRKDADAAVWALRRAFDAQASAASPSNGGRSGSGGGAATIIAQAIQKGVPLFNAGDARGCERMYKDTAQVLLAREDVGAEVQQLLSSAIEESRKARDAGAGAWALRRALDTILAAEQGGGAGHAAPSNGGSGRVAAGATNAWLLRNFVMDVGLELTAETVNDTVMGGMSSSSVRVSAEGAHFEGAVTRERNGGFASVRFRAKSAEDLAPVLAGARGMNFCVRRVNGARAWKVQLNEGRNGPNWQADFSAPSEEGQIVKVAFADFVPSRFGRVVGQKGLAPRSLQSVETFGFMLSFLTSDGQTSRGFQEGAFGLCVQWVGVYA